MGIWNSNFDRIYRESEGTKAMKKNANKSRIQMFKEGWFYLQSHRDIMGLILIKTFCNTVIGFAIPAEYYFGFKKFKLLNNGAFTMAMSGIVSAVVASIATYASNKYVGNDVKKMTNVIVFSMITMVVGIVIYSIGLNIATWIIGRSILFSSNMLIYSMLTTIIQKKVPDSVQGRVNSIGYNFRTLTWGIGILTSGYVLTYHEDKAGWAFAAMCLSQVLTMFYSIHIRIRFDYDSIDIELATVNAGRNAERDAERALLDSFSYDSSSDSISDTFVDSNVDSNSDSGVDTIQ